MGILVLRSRVLRPVDHEVDHIEWVTEMERSVPNHFYLELNFPEYMRANYNHCSNLDRVASML